MPGGRPWSHAAGGLLLVTALAVLPGCGLLGEDAPPEAGAAVLSDDQEQAHEQAVDGLAPAESPSSGTLESFWQDEIKELDPDAQFQGVGAVTGYTGWSVEGECGSLRPGDASYCPADGSVAYDENLTRRLFQEAGEQGPALVLAHEYGHHVAALVGLPVSGDSGELLADCLAGRFVAEGRDPVTLTDSPTASLYRWGQERLPDGWFAEDSRPPAHLRARAHLDGAFGGTSACAAYADWRSSEPKELGAFRWVASPALKVGTRADGALVGRIGDAAVVIAPVEPVEAGTTAADALDEVMGAWLGALSPELGEISEAPSGPTLGEGTGALRAYDYTDAEGEPAHGLVYLRVSPDGDGVLVSAAQSGVEPVAGAPGAATDPVTGPLFVAVQGLCSPAGDGAVCPEG